MRARLLALVFFLVSLPLAGQDNPPEKTRVKPAETPKTALVVGKDLPGAFNPFALNGPNKQHFHCFVSDHALNPGILIFVRGAEISDGLKDLLGKLDQLLEKKWNVLLGVFVIFVPEDLNNHITDDVRRKELATKIDDEIIKPLKLKHVLFGLTSPADIRAYALPETSQITWIAYNKYQVLSLQFLMRDGLTPDLIKELVNLTTTKLLGGKVK